MTMREEAIEAAARVWSTAVTDVPWDKLNPAGQAVMIKAAEVGFDAILSRLQNPDEEMVAAGMQTSVYAIPDTGAFIFRAMLEPLGRRS